MDRHLKERLVGAAVLVAAAIIFIPEMFPMLSGSHKTVVAPEAAAENTDANGVKTYTIDLSSPQVTGQRAATAQSQVETTVAPPPETPLPVEIPAEKKEESVRAAPELATLQDRNARELEQFAAEKQASEKTGEKTREKIPAEKPPVPGAAIIVKPATDKRASGAWAVQVASFGLRAKSEQIAADLQAKGFQAFVAASEVKGKTMYRVRVGPTPDRAAAESLLKKIKPLHPGAAVVPQ